MFERWAIKRQAVIMMPLKKSGIEFTAGINGHQGSVIGDSPTGIAKVLGKSDGIIGNVLGWMFNFDNESFNPGQGLDDFEGLASGDTKAKDKNQAINSFVKKTRLKPPSVNMTLAKYKKITDAAINELKSKAARNEESQKKKASYAADDTSWDDLKDKVGNFFDDWFDDLFGTIKEIFGADKDAGACEGGDVNTNGKAKNLSKYFKVIGPKIDAECKRQGLSQYAEIIKAKCMRESGGNYVSYPDVLQASESLGKPIGYLKSVDASITQGVKYFGSIVKKSNGDIKLALQSYNFGAGFIPYVNARGGKYTKELALSFSKYMVQKIGRKISRLEPGYGDVNYVDHVLAYYSGEMPSGNCEGGGFAASCPDVIGSKGTKKYRLSAATGAKQLVNLKEEKGMPLRYTIVGGTSYVRKGTAEALRVVGRNYQRATGRTLAVTSGWRPGDPNWHGTGWACDLDTPNTMKYMSGKMRFPSGKDKEDARELVQICIDAGFRTLYFGDYDICSEFNRKYGAGTMVYDPKGHYNHLHLSYTICGKG